jgi:CRISPR-associated endonuclease/helicase Cas3
MPLMFWGKAEKDGRWHPALLHMLDVGLVARALVHDALTQATMHRLSVWLGLTLDTVLRWLPFLVAAHDLGKVSPGVQRKVEALCIHAEKAGFPFVGNLESDHGLVTRVALGDLLVQADLWPTLHTPDARALASAVAAHHGSFHRADQTQSYRRRKPAEGEPWDRARRDVLSDLGEIFGMNSALPAPTLNEDSRSACLEWLAGFTTLCDWVGSDSQRFLYCQDTELDLKRYLTNRREIVRNALKAHGLGSAGFIANSPRSFGAMFPTTPEPRDVQRHVMELASQFRADFVVVEAATGSGKTETALALAENWGATNQMQGAYLALPTMATSNSLFGRMKNWISGMHGGSIEFHLLHGHALLNTEYEALLNDTRFAAISDGTHAAGGEAVASAWFTGRKRGLLAPFAVGTVDQALLSVLDARHQFLRLYGLAYKVLIFDEIHAYDTYTSTLIERLLAWARGMGCRVILLSATLPSGKLRSLVNSWSGGQAVLAAELPSLPRATLVGKDGVRVESLPKAGSTRPAVQVRLVASDQEVIADGLATALQGRGCAACICNTVRRAQDLYTILKGRLGIRHVTLIHAQMPLGERLRREERILLDFGRTGETRPDLHVVIGTQVLEQSLDVDFDLMFSELAPVDLILQRIGRLHRHERWDRPKHLDQPLLLLEEPPSVNGEPTFRRSDTFVYSEAALLRSWFALRNRNEIVADDVDQLILQVYDQMPEGISKQEQEWIVVADENEKRKTAKEEGEALARMIDLPDSEMFPDSPRSKAGILEEDDPQVHRALQALTRLGPPSISLVCLHLVDDAVFLDLGAHDPVNLDKKPHPEARRVLVQASVSVSNHSVYSHFKDQLPPSSWQKDPVLRQMRAVQFVSGAFSVPGFRLTLDPELGLLIESGSGREK